MKFTLDWLKEHLETDATLDQVVDCLTMVGLEVEGVENRAAGLEEFVVAHVLEAEQHPDADRLRVCKVDFGGDAPVQVVCGAPNARAGMKGVFARSGLHIPGTGITLKKAEIRGVESNGMLLSKHIKLLGAFNHLHIFIDPDPDPAKSWAERNRLFNMARSSWTDYDAKAMSKGAMIYERSAKTITLTPVWD